jgi:hypothetical protein
VPQVPAVEPDVGEGTFEKAAARTVRAGHREVVEVRRVVAVTCRQCPVVRLKQRRVRKVGQFLPVHEAPGKLVAAGGAISPIIHREP